ncbi:MAG: hypothetical protein K2X69_01645 [Silvanigrellaceae bacterium]|nr:hypothetical protein [Silvanigrellaceae bacterium]
MKILYVGIDVGKTLLDIYYSNKNLIIKNSLVEINNLILELPICIQGGSSLMPPPVSVQLFR